MLSPRAKRLHHREHPPWGTAIRGSFMQLVLFIVLQRLQNKGLNSNALFFHLLIIWGVQWRGCWKGLSLNPTISSQAELPMRTDMLNSVHLHKDSIYIHNGNSSVTGQWKHQRNSWLTYFLLASRRASDSSSFLASSRNFLMLSFISLFFANSCLMFSTNPDIKPFLPPEE